MSSAGNFPGAVSGTKSYFCYQCSRTVSIVLPPSSDPLCPRCNDGFLEECRNPMPQIQDQFHPLSNPFSSLLSAFFDLQNPSVFSRSAARTPRFSGGGGGGGEFDPFAFLQNHLQNMRDDHGGSRIQFVVENHPSGPGGFGIPSNIGDYFVGPGLEQLIQHLAENDPNRYGTPPAAKSAVETLPTVTIAEEHLNSEMNQCAVCQDEFEKGVEVKELPCKHLYHQDCILPWLELHSSCPVCRHELPTDDPDYATRGNTTGNSNAPDTGRGTASRGAGGEESEQNRTAERTVRISLPWPFPRRFGSGSGSGSGDSDGNNWRLF